MSDPITPGRDQDGKPLLYTPSEVARLYRVDPKTVTRWVASGALPPGAIVRTPGGHHRFHRAYIDALLCGETPE